ncbi:hypothetical protein [Alkalibaculum bacchi]|uniref:hypothetical protein n=1 Tax=Alkalibaculum bacchi TaxID=645887 RepID=UPI0026EE3851|nr:hypothetical protein [Alkalibaculum bacchi]
MEDARIEGFGCGGNNIEVECLKVKKVYFSCQLRECIEDQLFDLDFPTGDRSDFKYVRTEFGEASVEPIKCVPLFAEIDEYYARLRGVVAVPVYLVFRRKCDGQLLRIAANPIIEKCEQRDNKVRFPIDLVVFAPADFLRQGRFFPDAESIGEVNNNLVRFTGNDNVELTIGFFLIIKVLSEVQLKVPTFGFCDVPEASCDEVAPISDVFCEAFLDEDITPFPQRFFPPQRHQIADLEDDDCRCKPKRRCDDVANEVSPIRPRKDCR